MSEQDLNAEAGQVRWSWPQTYSTPLQFNAPHLPGWMQGDQSTRVELDDDRNGFDQLREENRLLREENRQLREALGTFGLDIPRLVAAR